MKIALSLAIIAFTTFCGWIFTKKYRKKKKFYAQFNAFNECFINEISYLRRPLVEFVATQRLKEEFAYAIELFFECLESDREIKGMLSLNDAFHFLTGEDKDVVEEYFQMLGKGDAASQKAYFSSVKQNLQTRGQQAEESSKKYGDLYIKLGFLCGIFLVILLL